LDRTCLRAAIWGYVTVEKIGGTRRRGERCELLNDLKEYNRHWNLKDKSLDRTLLGHGVAQLVEALRYR